MVHTIKSLNSQNINAVNYGLIDFEEIKIKTDSNTNFEYDDTKPNEITFIFVDANDTQFKKKVDLSEFGLNYNYILDKIRPYFELKNKL
jgi:hypothetical protein